MNKKDAHSKKVKRLQEQIKSLFAHSKFQNNPLPVSLQYPGMSHAPRSKSYKQKSYKIDFGDLNNVIQIDPQKRIAIVEPRVTMEELVRATLPYGLLAPVIPEFKGITVGGAIMGASIASSAHKWGLFNDACLAFEIICGDGTLLRASPNENQDVFYGIAGSYGSLGALVLAEIQLVPAKEFVHLRHHFFSDVSKGIEAFRKLSQEPHAPVFLDGSIFAKDLIVITEGSFLSKENIPVELPYFSLKSISSEWYARHVQELAPKANVNTYEEVMSLQDYLFRYDQRGLRMGSYLFRIPFFMRSIGQRTLNLWKPCQGWLNKGRAKKWLLNPCILQDLCIPESRIALFFEEVLKEPGRFLIWFGRVKSTSHPQIFMPHLLSKENPMDDFIDVGLYGFSLPSTSMEKITREVELKVKALGGRKFLYGRSCYTPDEFWQIYSKEDYEALREKTCAKGIWHEITDKVLSI